MNWEHLVLDKPEDRLYHASDGTWWYNPNGPEHPTLKRVDPPPYVAAETRRREAAEAVLDKLIEGGHVAPVLLGYLWAWQQVKAEVEKERHD